MANQASRKDRRAVADVVIENSGPLGDLDAQVDDAWAGCSPCRIRLLRPRWPRTMPASLLTETRTRRTTCRERGDERVVPLAGWAYASGDGSPAKNPFRVDAEFVPAGISRLRSRRSRLASRQAIAFRRCWASPAGQERHDRLDHRAGAATHLVLAPNKLLRSSPTSSRSSSPTTGSSISSPITTTTSPRRTCPRATHTSRKTRR